MRHGQSKANLNNIIVSSLANGVLLEYGLTKFGLDQTKKSTKQFISEVSKSEPFVIAYSPFSRAKETAFEAAKYIPNNEIVELTDLRERDFGELELMHSSNYNKFWLEDVINPDSSIFKSESPNEVCKRMMGVVEYFESRQYPAGQRIILVSHGDPLQILLTLFRGVPVSRHNLDLDYLANAEIIRLN